jgi:acyl carrier protein
MDSDQIKHTVKGYILDEFLPGEDPAALTDDTPMITGGVLDSLATLRLVSFLEERFGLTLEAHEVDTEYLDTLDRIAALVVAKQGA